MADPTLEERATWNEGDLVFLGPDGKKITIAEMKKRAAEREAVENSPTLHLYLPAVEPDKEEE